MIKLRNICRNHNNFLGWKWCRWLCIKQLNVCSHYDVLNMRVITAVDCVCMLLWISKLFDVYTSIKHSMGGKGLLRRKNHRIREISVGNYCVINDSSASNHVSINCLLIQP